MQLQNLTTSNINNKQRSNHQQAGPHRRLPIGIPQDVMDDEGSEESLFPQTPQRFGTALEELARAGHYQLSTPADNDIGNRHCDTPEDVPTTSAFDRKHFQWLESELSPVRRSLYSNGVPSCDLGFCVNPEVGDHFSATPSEVNTGYGADVDESPRRSSRRHQTTTRIILQQSSGVEVKKPSIMCLGNANHRLKTMPGEGSSRQRSVTFVDPIQVVDQVTNTRGGRDPFAYLDPFNSNRSPRYSPGNRPRARALTSPSCSPCLGESDSEWTPARVEMKHHIASPSSRMDLLLPRLDGGGHGQSASPTGDLNRLQKSQGSRIKVIGKEPRRPSVAPLLLPQRVSILEARSAGGIGQTSVCTEDLDIASLEAQPNPIDNTSPPPPGGFPLPLPFRLCGLDAPVSAETVGSLNAQQERAARHAEEIDILLTLSQSKNMAVALGALDLLAEVNNEEALQSPNVPQVLPSEKLAQSSKLEAQQLTQETNLPSEKQQLVKNWAMGTYEATVMLGINQVDSPASGGIHSPPPTCSTTTTEWKVITVEEDCLPGASGRSIASVIPFAYDDKEGEDVVTRMTVMDNCAVTAASTSGGGESPKRLTSVAMKRTRRFALGSHDIVSPKPLRPARIPSIQHSVHSPPKPSPIKRAFHLPWKTFQDRKLACTTPAPTPELDCYVSPTPSSWFASRSPGWGCSQPRSCSGPAAIRPPVTPQQIQRSPVESSRFLTTQHHRPALRDLFHRRVQSSAVQRRPRTPYAHNLLTDGEGKQENSGTLGLGIGIPLGSPIESNRIIMKGCDKGDGEGEGDADPPKKAVEVGAATSTPLLIDLSTPQVPQPPTMPVTTFL